MELEFTLNLHAGEWVEVRSKAEILATLNQAGQLEDLPFMPEMLLYCGRRFHVHKRAHKTCDFATRTGIRRLSNAVHLEGVRCDGAAHGGCRAECLIFWKEAWLKRVSGSDSPEPEGRAASDRNSTVSSNRVRGEETVWVGTRAPGQRVDDLDPTYVCQATQLPHFTQPLSPWDPRPYVEDYRSGNVTSLRVMATGFLYRTFDNLMNLGIGWGSALRWLYDRFQHLRGGIPYPALAGKIPAGARTPACSLDLQPGELVRVKDYRAILETVDTDSKNRGMAFSAEMVPYCGGTYRVWSRVNQIIDERTGKMLTMKTSSVILEGVACQARYNKRMLFCPRGTFAYWREAWLERVENPQTEVERPHTRLVPLTLLPRPLVECCEGTSSAGDPSKWPS